MIELTAGMYQITCLDNGSFCFKKEENKIVTFYAQAIERTKGMIDTRTCKILKTTKEENQKKKESGGILTISFLSASALIFTEKISLQSDGTVSIKGEVTGQSGEEVHVIKILPFVMEAPDSESPSFLRSLWTKMLVVPYDNTMWVRYEALPLRPGRTSYDVTALFQEDSREGLVIGAEDFDTWKNAVYCSGREARVLEACSGTADKATHDSCPHGIVSGTVVASARFLLLYGMDYRRLLEKYGMLLKNSGKNLKWKGGVPFGWNSWAGFALRLDQDNFREAGTFIRNELMPRGYENNRTAYVNLDAGWNKIPEEELKNLVGELHGKGQKAGIYDAPFAWFGKNPEDEIPGVQGHTYSDILLKDENGIVLPRVDGAVPLDITHPLWIQHEKWQLERFIRWGFDYVKLDFLSHGAMEGNHWNKNCMTGRQALMQGYTLINETLDEYKIGRPLFISLSIAPLFPHGFGHARRFACDAFGLAEDVEYVLNALTYAWWQNTTLYQYNDPDHICLYKSFCADRPSLEGEARARYTASVISGTVMMLSDDYGIPEARQRTIRLSSNKEINTLATSGKSFVPVEAAGASASKTFVLEWNGQFYAALFHWKDQPGKEYLDLKRAGLPHPCKIRDLWTDKEMLCSGDVVSWNFTGCDSALFKLEKV
jgi:hypothetical protein